METTMMESAAAAARRFALACGVLSQHVRVAGPAPVAAARAGPAQERGARPADGAQQLTIFYGGRVAVLDGCSPSRAAELILYATAAATPAPAPVPVDIPIARKASLRRFISKRKDRSVPEVGRWEEAAAPAKKAKTADSSWLALGSLGNMHAH